LGYSLPSGWKAAQLSLEDLARGVPGQFGHEDYFARLLERGEPAAAVLDQLAGSRVSGGD
jgi:hypothetical protein